jgi:hypothetical protein
VHRSFQLRPNAAESSNKVHHPELLEVGDGLASWSPIKSIRFAELREGPAPAPFYQDNGKTLTNEGMTMIQLANEEYAALVAERDSLTVKTAALGGALKRAHDLILHIEDVLPDESFNLIDTASWNVVTSDMRAWP